MLLKKDTFGEVSKGMIDSRAVIERDASRAAPWARGVARWLLARESRALAQLDGVEGVPQLLTASADRLCREFAEGEPLYVARPTEPQFFKDAAKLLRKLHSAGVIHNDLAKEPNILVQPDGQPMFIDFQLATVSVRRNWLHRILGREDIRHLLKHKRTYCPAALTQRERAILETPALPSRLFAVTVKPIYMFVTRRILRWADREGAGDRTLVR